MIFLSKWLIFRFHVNLPGCKLGGLGPGGLDFCGFLMKGIGILRGMRHYGWKIHTLAN